MPLLDDKTRADLGWDKLIEHLAARCHTSRGAALARQVELSIDGAAVRARLEEVDEAKGLHDTGEPMLFGGVVELRPALERAAKGGHLDGPALREVAEALLAATRLRRHLGARLARAPRLAGRAALCTDLPDVYTPIGYSFDDNGRLHDSASPALGPLRRRVDGLHDELGKRARALLDHPAISPHLQDRFYTQREERYVLPVRADARGRLKGIVHGTSGSGQTVFVEPEEIVDLNNRLKLAELEVADEERRILGELTLLVKDALPAIERNLEILTDLDFIDAGARLSVDCGGRAPVIAEPTDGGARLDLRNARHPLMVLAGSRCVPNDIVLSRGHSLVVSGPNAGGKTVALKTAGLLVLMARAGLHLPAQEGSQVVLFPEVLTDVGDDQSIEANLSTFSAHVGHLKHFLAAAGPGTLLLLDEIAVGTDPEQGAALAQAVLEAFAGAGATVIVTTHYDRLKALAARDPRFHNASVGFDLDRLEPTYRLHLGIPGASGAIVVARRLGLPGEIADRASALAGTSAQGLEELLRLVDRERARMVQATAAAELDRRAAEEERRRAEALAEEAARRLAAARKAAHDDAVGALQRTRLELEGLRKELKQRATPEGLSQAQKQLDQAAAKVREHAPAAPQVPVGRAATVDDLLLGAEVVVPRLGSRGQVVSAPRDGRVGVQLGALRLTVDVSDLALPPGGPRVAPSRPSPPPSRVAAGREPVLPRTSANTCDLRGERVDDALAIAEKFLDDALRGGQDVAFFLHGHGTGALRAALRERLAELPGVASFRPGEPSEGGDGVTAVILS